MPAWSRMSATTFRQRSNDPSPVGLAFACGLPASCQPRTIDANGQPAGNDRRVLLNPKPFAFEAVQVVNLDKPQSGERGRRIVAFTGDALRELLAVRDSRGLFLIGRMSVSSDEGARRGPERQHLPGLVIGDCLQGELNVVAPLALVAGDVANPIHAVGAPAGRDGLNHAGDGDMLHRGPAVGERVAHVRDGASVKADGVWPLAVRAASFWSREWDGGFAHVAFLRCFRGLARSGARMDHPVGTMGSPVVW